METLRTTVDDLKAGQVMMQDELEQARAAAQEAQDAAEEFREAEAARKGSGRLRRAWAALRGR